MKLQKLPAKHRPKLNASGLSLSYQLDATSAAGVITSTTRIVTYTITGGV